MRKRIFNTSVGFTMVELLMVVAIGGILAVVGAINYENYKARSLQAEAKLGLAALHVAEKGFATENGSYSACLVSIGYAPESNAKRYYAIGFPASLPSSCGVNGMSDCYGYSFNAAGALAVCGGTGNGFAAYNANVAIPSSTDPTLRTIANQSNIFPAMSGSGAPPMTQTQFTAGAGGAISSRNANYDRWTIDQDKNLKNTFSGL